MMVYIVTYRYMADRERGIWSGDRVLQEAYTSLEDAHSYIRSRPEKPLRVNNWYFKTDNFEEYYIRQVRVKGTG